MAELKPIDGTDVYLWKYLPSIPVAAVFLLLFTIATGILCWKIIKSRTWFCIAFTIGGFFQIFGYVVRIVSHWYTNLIAPNVIQSCLILLAPVFYAASIYMVLGRLIRSVHGEEFSIIRPRWMTKVFVSGDLLSLTLQGNAAGLTTKESTKTIGEAIITAGLFVQLIVFGFFIVAAIIFHKRMRRDRVKTAAVAQSVPWEEGLRMLYICSALIMVRSVFRIIEYIMGVDAYLLSTEWPMYVFDAALMFLVQVVFVVWFPDQFTKPEDDHIMLDNEVQGR